MVDMLIDLVKKVQKVHAHIYCTKTSEAILRPTSLSAMCTSSLA